MTNLSLLTNYASSGKLFIHIHRPHNWEGDCVRPVVATIDNNAIALGNCLAIMLASQSEIMERKDLPMKLSCSDPAVY